MSVADANDAGIGSPSLMNRSPVCDSILHRSQGSRHVRDL